MHRLVFILSVLIVGWSGCGDDSGGGNDNVNNQNSTGECGDGVQDLGEACDDGAANSDAAADACRTDCRLPYCSDGVVDSGEECDDGGANSDTEPDGCRTDCRAAHCQDGVLDQGEGCDDGNDVASDGCGPDCSVEDHWDCSGSPSVCVCADYYLGPGCGSCAVRVKADSIVASPDGVRWDTAFLSVQDGIQRAQLLGSGCEVWATGGTYYVYDGDTDDTIRMRTGVSLFGGFAGTETTRDQRDWVANPSVLDGMREGSTLLDADFVTHVITANETEDATLDGFVVTGGWAQSAGMDELMSGAGMLVSQLIGTADVGVVNCTFRNNRAYKYGGAIAVFGGTLRVHSSMIYGNTSDQQGGGISGRNFSQITVVDSTISQNVAFGTGGGIFDPFGDVTVISSVFYGNHVFTYDSTQSHGAGIHGSTSTVIRNCTFANNDANNLLSSAGSAVYQAAEVTNCAFDDNSVNAIVSVSSVTYSQVETPRLGAGNVTGSPQLVRQPITLHRAQMLGDTGLAMPDSSVFAVGDVIEINNDGVLRTIETISLPEFLFFTPAFVGVRIGYFMVEKWGSGATTVQEDLSLQASSACIDTANDTAAPATDRLGNVRVDVSGVGTAGTFADRGAYEYQP